MSKRKKIFSLLLVIFCVILLVLVYFRIRTSLADSNVRPQSIPTIVTLLPAKEEIVNKLSYTGDILAIQQANIYSRVAGNIQKIYVNAGDYVTSGKLLALIDQSIYIQNLHQSEALYDQNIATVENNKANYERNLELFNKNLLSKTDVDNSETALKVSQSQLQSSLASFKNAQTQLDYCRIQAPFSGYITKRLLDPGAYVSVGTQNSNSILFVISDLNFLKVMVNVLEKDLPLIDRIKEAVVTTDVYPEEIFNASVKAITQQFDLGTRTMPVEIDIPNKKNLLKPGMYASIDLIIEKQENALVLPRQSILKDNKGDYVYQVTPDSLVHKIYVQVGIKENNKCEIISGIKAEDRIVSVGQEFIKDGIKVKLSN